MYREQKKLKLKESSLESFKVKIDFVEHSIEAKVRRREAMLKLGKEIPDDKEDFSISNILDEIFDVGVVGGEDG